MTSYQKSGATIRVDNFQVDYKNLIGFTVAIWEEKNLQLVLRVANTNFYGKGSCLNDPRFHGH